MLYLYLKSLLLIENKDDTITHGDKRKLNKLLGGIG